jgi:serralysin
MPTLFAKTIKYYENRADNGFGWYPSYDLSFDGTSFRVETRVDFTGAPVATSVWQGWERAIELEWGRFRLQDSSGTTYPINIDFRVVDDSQGEHHNVNIAPGSGRANMTNWFETSTNLTAIHEFGHMIGNFDEYSGGATYQGRTKKGTIMADSTLPITTTYMYGIEFYAEQTTGLTFSTISVGSTSSIPTPTTQQTNTSSNSTTNTSSTGTANTGNPGTTNTSSTTQSVNNASSGSGPSLAGGTGANRLTGTEGADRFTFASFDTNSDTIINFNSEAGDKLVLYGDAFGGWIGANKDLYLGIAYTYKKQMKLYNSKYADIIYNASNGQLLYNQNEGQRGLGAGGGLFAILEGAPTITRESFEIV